MNISRAQADKLVVGTTDVGYLPTDRNPVGSAVLNGPVFVGAPVAAPLYKAVLNVGPPAPPLLPGLNPPLVTPFSLWVDGLSNQVGIHLHAGVRVQKGMNFVSGSRITSGLNFTSGVNITSSLLMGKPVMEGGHILSNKKNLPFDMPHPNKEGWRLRHVCIEGPEIAVYCRGKVPSDGIINLPTFWDGLVNPEDMSINLTPIGCWQELFVKETRHSKQVIVANNTGGPINADYYIVARRLDDDLVVEYEGESHEDYPGGNEGYSFNFEHNYVEGLIRNMVSETVNNVGGNHV